MWYYIVLYHELISCSLTICPLRFAFPISQHLCGQWLTNSVQYNIFFLLGHNFNCILNVFSSSRACVIAAQGCVSISCLGKLMTSFVEVCVLIFWFKFCTPWHRYWTYFIVSSTTISFIFRIIIVSQITLLHAGQLK